MQVNSNSDSMSVGVYTGIHVHILNNLRAHKTSPSIITIRKFSNLRPNSDCVLLSCQTKFRNYVQQNHGIYIKFLNSLPQAMFYYYITLLYYYITLSLTSSVVLHDSVTAPILLCETKFTNYILFHVFCILVMWLQLILNLV